MLNPYTGNALKTYEKVHPQGAYFVNKLYKFGENKYYYINSKGYMHFRLIGRVRFHGKYLYYVSGQTLTKDNMLKDTGVYSSYYDELSQAIDRLNEIAQEAC